MKIHIHNPKKRAVKIIAPKIINIFRLSFIVTINKIIVSLLLFFCINNVYAGATAKFTIANPTTPIIAVGICANSTKVPIHAFKITADGTSGSGILTNFQFHPSGTYTAAEIVNYKIWSNSSDNLSTATLIAANTAPGTSDPQTFPAFSSTITFGATVYYWITIDVASSITNGHTITVGQSLSTDMTTTKTKLGLTNASGTQTFSNPPSTPTAAPTTLSLTSITSSGLNGSFTTASPAASGYLVVRSISSTLSANPVDGTTYIAGNTIGGGTVVQASATTTFTESTLSANTTYYYFVFSYNNTSCAGGPKYYTTSLQNNATTCPLIPTSLITSVITSSGFTLGWTAPAGGATDYTIDISLTNFGASIAGFPQTTSSTPIVITGLNPYTTYYYKVKANNVSCSSAYATVGSITTLCASPSTQATSFTSSSITSTTMTVGWTRGNGANVLVIAKAGSAPTDPISGTTYTANAAYGSGTAVGGGFCVYNGTGTSVNLTALIGSTTYYFAIYEYNTSGTCYNLIELTGIVSTTIPAFNGTFSGGTSFPANLMTVANDVTNQWYVGTATHNGAPNSAYISNNSGTSNAYTNSTAQISHFYFDYVFPAGQTIITLDFDWKCNGEGSTSDYDNLKVFLAPTSITPTAASAVSSSYLVGNNWYNLQTTWQHATITLNSANAGTTGRIIFSWKNDGSMGSDAPAAVDNIVIATSAPASMAFSSCTSLQSNTSSVPTNTTNQQVLDLQVVTSGTLNPLSATSFTFNTTGTTAPGTDITNAKLWYTGITNTFATTTQVGSTVASPNGTFTFTTTQTLSAGTNYFWLTYDIPNGAIATNVIDAQCTSITVGTAQTPSTQNPTGSRTIVNEVTIGTGTSTSGRPFYSTDGYSRSASLFTSAEVGAPCLITQLAYNVSTATAVNLPVKIYLKTTTASSLIADTWANMISGAILVYDGTTQFTPTGWKNFDITDYSYCADNLIVLCETNYGGSGAGSTPSFYYTTAGSATHEYWNTDTSPPTGSGTTGTSRPNIKIIKATAAAMSFTSSTATQNNTTEAVINSTNQEVIGMQVVTSGCGSPLTASSFTVNITGTTLPADITNLKLWTTGTSSTFATTTQLGATIVTPTGSHVITGGTNMPYTLSSGTNYFWITYDIPAGATIGNVIDAQCTSITIDGTPRVPTVTNPAGTRPIQAIITIGTGTSTIYNLPWNGDYNWSWSSSIYTKSEVNLQGSISTLSYYVDAITSPYATTNHRVYMANVPISVFPDATRPDTSAMTLVYDGNLTYTGPGWYTITLNTVFYYNNTDNLMIYYESRDGSYVTGYPYFRYTATADNKSKYANSDTYASVYPTSSAPSNTVNRPNIKLNFTPCAIDGGTISGVDSIPNNTTTILTVSGYTLTGTSLQWQQSLNGCSGWANVTGGSGATTPTYTTPSLTVKTYYRVKITNGCSAYSYTHIVVPVVAPTCATYTNPSNAATNVFWPLNLTWSAPGSGGTPSGYKIYFGTDAAATNILNGVNYGKIFSYTVNSLNPNTLYYWKIVPTNFGGDATGCTIWSFRSVAAPNCATLLTPANLATNVPTNTALAWSAPGSGGTPSGYKLYFGTDAAATNIENGTNIGAGTTYSPPLAISTTYYWKIVPTNCVGDAVGCSTIWWFTTAATNPVIISTNDGGFENATSTLIANGWTAGSGTTQTNKWFVGINQFNAGAKGAYIDNGTGATNAYTITTTSISHFYRQVNFPAGQTKINLTFDWKAQGESTYDYLRVFLVPTGTTITEGTALYSGQVGSTYNLQGTTWQSVNITIPASYAGTSQLLVFSWVNDASGGTQPPAAVDNIAITTTIPNPPNCATIVVPTDGNTDVCPANVNLSWTAPATGDAATSYKLFFGTDAAATNIYNGISIGNVTSYSLGMLSQSTQYYWKIAPVNAGGAATGCPIWTFTTNSTGAISVFPYSINFDDVTAPDIPCGITVTNDNADAQYWKTSAGSGEARSTPNCIKINYNGSHAMNDWFFSRPLTLVAGTTYNVKFYYRGYSTSYNEKLEVKWGASPSAAGMTNGPIFNNSTINFTVFTSGEGTFTPSSSGDYYVGFHGYSAANTDYIFVDDIRISVLSLPDCAGIISPTNGATSVGITCNSLNWDIPATGGDPSGYKLYLGTDNPPTNIVNGTNLGDVLTYDVGTLVASTTYYWKIIPTNAVGDAVGCATWSFVTGATGNITSFPYTQGFENAVPPALPCGITQQSLATSDVWETTTDKSNSGVNSAYIDYNYSYATDDWLFLPAFTFTAGNNYLVSFFYRAKNSYDIEKLEVKWGTSASAAGMINGPIYSNISMTNTSFSEGTGAFTPGSTGTYYIGFHGFSNADEAGVYLDDITITLCNPIANNTISSAQTICAATAPTSLTGSTPTGGTGNYTYQWQNSPDNSTWTNINGAISINYAPPIIYANTYYRRVVSSSGVTPNISASLLITVNPLITPSLSINTATPTICQGASVTFTATPTNGGTPAYQWKNNGTNVGTNSSSFTTSTLSNYDVINCVMSSTATCVSPATATSNDLLITITNCNPNDGLYLSGNFTNNGTIIHTNDPNYCIMNGTSKLIDGAGIYTDFKLRAMGSTTFDGVISSGSFKKLLVDATKSFTINTSKIFIAGTSVVTDSVTNNGTLTIMDNSTFNSACHWINNATATAGAGSTIIFNSTLVQNVNTNATLFYNWTVQNASTAGVTLLDDATATKTITFIDGILNTGSNKMIGTSTDVADVTGDTKDSYINGNFRKYITTNTGTYRLPIGTVDRYRLAELINNNLTGITYIDSKFLSTYTSTGSLDAAKAFDGALIYQGTAIEGIWQIDPNSAPAGGNYSIKLWINGGAGANAANAFQGLVDNEFAALKRSSSSSLASDWQGQPIGTINAASGAGRLVSNGYALRSGISGFSQQGIGKKTGNLPVELLDFAGYCSDNKINLFWTTASEFENDYFNVEHSSDGQNFNLLTSINGMGTSNVVNTYSFIDESSADITNYYRLKQVDFDGFSTYYGPIAISCQDNVVFDLISIMNNVEDHYFSISFIANEGELFTVCLYDIVGNKLINKTANAEYSGLNKIKLPYMSLGHGIYLITFENDFKLLTRKVIMD